MLADSIRANVKLRKHSELGFLKPASFPYPGAVLVLMGLMFGNLPMFGATNDPIRLFMPDGQIKSHLLRVFVSRDISETDAPKLKLLTSRILVQQLPSWAEKPLDVLEHARFQHWSESLDGHEIGRDGTLLIFDLRGADFPWFKACMRVTPVVEWGESHNRAVAEQPVYIGNLKGAMLWTIAIVLLLLGWICVLACRTKLTSRNGMKNCLWLLARKDGRLSLSKTQAAVWTIAVGAMVFCFGILRLKPPVIPESLVALMGLSLATRALTFTTEAAQEPESTNEPHWRDLIDGAKEAKNPMLAITRAQMVFWTILLVFLFCVKSILDGELWEVPWSLVALMGMSQTSYLVPVLSTAPKNKGEGKDNPGPSSAGGD